MKELLFQRLESSSFDMKRGEALAWHKGFAEFQKGLYTIRKNEALYHKAIEEQLKSPLVLTEAQRSLLSLHELTQDISKAELQKAAPNIKAATFVLDAETITHALMEKPEEAYRAIFGNPNKTTSREMRYSGGLIVALKGKKAGLWYDFSAGVGGNPFSALMRERGLSFQEALKEGAAIAPVGIFCLRLLLLEEKT